MSCELTWARSENLNSKLFVSGYGFTEIGIGAFQEGQRISTQIKANYGNPLGGFFSYFYNPFRSSYYCLPKTILYDLPLTVNQKANGLSFDPNTGVLSGRILDVDAFIDGESNRKFAEPESYFEYARRPNPRKITFQGKAFLEDDPSVFIEREFYMLVATSWDSRRRALMIGPNKIQSDFYIDGKKATNEQYYGYLQSRGWI